MVIEDEREPIRTSPEGQHRPVIGSGAAVHEQQRVPASDDFNEEGNVPNRYGRHELVSAQVRRGSLWRPFGGTHPG
jgi:hypothetical protein